MMNDSLTGPEKASFRDIKTNGNNRWVEREMTSNSGTKKGVIRGDLRLSRATKEDSATPRLCHKLPDWVCSVKGSMDSDERP
jgi:hypothetical protein